MNKYNKKLQILEGSNAIANTINNIKPSVVSAYPITPQTHIVEDLAQLKANGKAKYEFINAESEFAAASIVLGSSAVGLRSYTATSSQGLLLMSEVLYNIAGMKIPIVLTCANRAISAPINIWNDQQDAMAIRDAGFIMFFAENNQEAIDQHIMAFKIAEKLRIPVMVNIDGFILTHTYEPVYIPSSVEIKKYLPAYKPNKKYILDTKNPKTFGHLVTPEHYLEIRKDLHEKLIASTNHIDQEYNKYQKIFNTKKINNYNNGHQNKKHIIVDNGLIEYYGPKNPKTILIAMGSVIGTIKEVVDEINKVGVLKIKVFRPFPINQILDIIKSTKQIAILDKAISLGASAPLASEIKTICSDNNLKINIQSFVIGLGGRDITKEKIEKIINTTKKGNKQTLFIS